MNPMDLHPEALFDAMRVGGLSAVQRARLEAHCAQCPACLFELRWLDTQLGAATPSADDRAYGEAAFDRVLRTTKPAPRARARPARWLLRWGVGSLLLGAGFGAVFLAERALWPTAKPPIAAHSRPESPPIRDAPQVAPVEARAYAPPSDPVPTAPQPSTADKPSANLLLAAARQASTQGELQRAARLYRQVIERFPTSLAAGAAQLALGRLLQAELGRPRAAMTLFDSYLRQHPRGALAEDALYYRALSLESLGRAHEAEADLRRLVSMFPRSLYVPPARARLTREHRQ